MKNLKTKPGLKILERGKLSVDENGQLKAFVYDLEGIVENGDKLAFAVRYEKAHPQKFGFAIIHIFCEFGITPNQMAAKLKVTMDELEAMAMGQADIPDYIIVYLVNRYKVNPAYLYHDKVEDVFFDI